MSNQPQPNQPNILVIMTDQQKATANHLYGNTFCETPTMQRFDVFGPHLR